MEESVLIYKCKMCGNTFEKIQLKDDTRSVRYWFCVWAQQGAIKEKDDEINKYNLHLTDLHQCNTNAMGIGELIGLRD